MNKAFMLSETESHSSWFRISSLGTLNLSIFINGRENTDTVYLLLWVHKFKLNYFPFFFFKCQFPWCLFELMKFNCLTPSTLLINAGSYLFRIRTSWPQATWNKIILYTHNLHHTHTINWWWEPHCRNMMKANKRRNHKDMHVSSEYIFIR